MTELAESAAAPTRPEAGGGRWLLELAALAELGVGLWALARAWPDLPDVVPVHFGASGRPDGWGSRGTLLLLPAVSVGVYLLLTFVQRLGPHWYNYPVDITDENRARQHRLARDLLLWMKAILMGLFAHLTIGVVRTALGEAAGLGATFVLLWSGALLAIVGVYVVRARRAA